MTEFTIRAAGPDDIDLLVRNRGMIMRAHGNSDENVAKMEDAWRAWMSDHFADGTFLAFLAISPEGETAACAGLWLVDWLPGNSSTVRRRGHVTTVYTEPAFRRHGLATRLVERCIAECRTRGIVLIGLHASEEGRPVYERLGFRANETEMRLKL